MTIVNQRGTFDVDSFVGRQSAWNCKPLRSVSNVLVCALSDQMSLTSGVAPLHVALQPASHARSGVPDTVPLRASQQLLGAGEVSGTFLLELQRGRLSSDSETGRAPGREGPQPTLIVCSRTTLPWFLCPWIHTLEATVDGVQTSLRKVLHPTVLAALSSENSGACLVMTMIDRCLCL